uniref:Origin recognition complex subunit 3 n=1 Tax=Cebus imitator TaxID=2715852 RepID=A0A2K5PS50_CEBIM
VALSFCVLILKDMESFATKLLQDFIIISSQYLHEFPLILIFVISCKEHLTMVLDKLLLTTQFTFKINEKVLQVLTNIFLYHDFSIRNFIKGLQLSLLEHFYSQDLSVLYYNLPEQASEKQVVLLTNERCLKEETQLLLENLHVYHMNYFLNLRCLHKFTSSLPKHPLGRQIRELCCTCLEKNIWDSEEYASVLQLLRMLAKDERMTILEKRFKVFKSSCAKHLGSTDERIEECLALFQSLDRTKEEEDDSGSQPKVLQKPDLYHLQKSLLEMTELRRSKKQTRFEVLRENVNFIDCLVREYLLSPETQPLHKAVYFSTAHALPEHSNAAPRIALHTARNNPII